MKLLVLFILFFASSSAIAEDCPSSGPQIVPEFFEKLDNSEYDAHESGLQIFDSHEVPCDGLLIEWQFMSDLAVFSNNINFAVFRKTEASTEDDPVWDVVGRTRLGMAPDGWKSGEWTAVLVSEPFDVKAGDKLGLFYDSWEILANKVLIPSRVDGPESGFDVYVYEQDASSVVNNVVSGDNILEARNPAFYARIAKPGVKKTTAVPPTQPPTTTAKVTTAKPTTIDVALTSGKPSVVTTQQRPTTTAAPTTRRRSTTARQTRHTTRARRTTVAVTTTLPSALPEADPINDIVRKVFPDFVKQAGFLPAMFRVIDYDTEPSTNNAVPGDAYYVKVQISGSAYVHLSIFKMKPVLAGLNMPPILLGFLRNKLLSDPIEPFLVGELNNGDDNQKLTPLLSAAADEEDDIRVMVGTVLRDFERYNTLYEPSIFLPIFVRQQESNRRIFFVKTQTGVNKFVHLKIMKLPGSTSPMEVLMLGYQLDKSYNDSLNYF